MGVVAFQQEEYNTTAREPWRDSVLRGMLTVAAIITPLMAVLALFLRPSPRSWLDHLVIASCGVLVPVLRIVPGSGYGGGRRPRSSSCSSPASTCCLARASRRGSR